MDLTAIRRALAARAPVPLDLRRVPEEMVPAGGLRPAAVLVPLLERGRGAEVLLTLRRSDLRHHAGQVSFPGGRVEPGETTAQAALREAHEEVGLDPSQVELLGALDDTLVLATGFRLTPWVGCVPHAYPYVAHPAEVEQLLYVPLADLMRPGVHSTEQHAVLGATYRVHFYRLPEVTVWGATARVLHQLLVLSGAELSASLARELAAKEGA